MRVFRLAFLTLIFIWISTGLVGHAPWKPDEPIHFGIILTYAHHAKTWISWMIPTLIDEPLFEYLSIFYPVSYWLARALRFCLEWLFPDIHFHDWVRLTQSFYIFSSCYFLFKTSRLLFENKNHYYTIILLLGSLGLLIRGHEINPNNGVLFAISLTFYGLILFLQRPLKGSLYYFFGIISVLLFKGLMLGLAFFFTLFIYVFIYPRKNQLLLFALTLICLIGYTFSSFFFFTHYAPALKNAWIQTQYPFVILSPFILKHYIQYIEHFLYYIKLSFWYLLPSLPLAIWTIWHHHQFLRSYQLSWWGQFNTHFELFEQRLALQNHAYLLLILFNVVYLFLIILLPNTQDLLLYPLILLCALLATPALYSLRRGALAALNWFSFMGFTVFAGGLWIIWLSLQKHWIFPIVLKLMKFQPGYVPQINWVVFIMACGISLLWLALITWLHTAHQKTLRLGEKAIFLWTGGLTLMWGLLSTLWLSWIDTGKSYARPMHALQRVLTKEMRRIPLEDHACVSTRSLGRAQRAMFYYYTGLRGNQDPHHTCDFLLIQKQSGEFKANLHDGYANLIWQGYRPGDDIERFYLWQKIH